MRIGLVGGGTGGHFYPLIAIAEAVRDRDAAHNTNTELLYFGPEPYNQESLARLNIRFVYCPAGKRRRYFSPLNFLDIFKTIFGFICAVKRLYLLYPDVIMSKGSYTSVPIVLAAWLLRIPIVIHESDAKVGRANKIAGRFARYIGITYNVTAEQFKADKTALTGQPIRKYMRQAPPNAPALLGIPTDRPAIFITGGSTGAVRINNLILDSLDELLPQFTVIHQVGTENVETVTSAAGSLISNEDYLKHYFVFGHMTGEQIAAAYYSSAIVVSRAGSGTIAELSITGKPAILIPIPEEISHDQRTNAYAYAKRGGATVLEEDNLTDSMLAAQITKILTDKKLYTDMSEAAMGFTQPNAAYTLADTLLGIGKEHL